MKTIEATKKRLQEIYATPTRDLSKRDNSKLSKEAKELELVKKYLETSPRKEFVNSELVRLQKEVEILNAGYGDWLDGNSKAKESKNPKSMFQRELGITDRNRQIKALKFILKTK